jgi:putative ABC transport system permease protein
MNDFRHALRRLRATPVVTLSAVACLAIGVWMTCITSAIAFAWFWPNLHLPEQERLVEPASIGLFSVSDESRSVSPRVYDAMTRDPAYTAVGFYEFSHAYPAGEENWFPVEKFSSSMMRVLRVTPILGRGFLPSDDTVGGVMILSHRLWRVRYASDSNVIGRRVRFKDEVKPRTIIGVMPATFAFPRLTRADAYLSAEWSHPTPARIRPERYVVARLAPGADRAAAEERLRLAAVQTLAADRADMAEWLRPFYKRGRTPPEQPRGAIGTRLDRYRHPPIPPQQLRLLLLILSCGLAVVAVAVANVVNLLLVRGAARRQEIAVRMALGAERMRVVRELVIETLMLALPALLLGFVIAWQQWRSINPAFSQRDSLGEIDVRVAVVAIAAALTLSLIAGVWPGLRATSMGLEQVLRDAKRSGVTDSPLDGLLSRLVTASTAATVMLLICAALLGFSARDAANGMNSTQTAVLASNVSFDDAGEAAARLTSAKTTLTNLRGLPGVWFASFGPVPLSQLGTEIFASLTGEPNRRLGPIGFAISDGYFETMSIQVLRGRGFTVRETRDSSGLVVITRALAGTLFPGRDAIGQRFRLRQGNDSAIVDAEVIGVVEGVTTYGFRPNQLFRTIGSVRDGSTTALVRYRRRMPPQPKDVAAALAASDGITAGPVASIAERQRRFDPVRHYMSIGFAMFAIVGLIIAIVGTYGVVAYSVVRRTHEIGVRLALGADGARVSRMVIEQGMKITLTGVAVGVVLAAAAVRLLGGFIQDLEIGYGGAIGVVIALVCVLSLVASAIPALRAARMNPVDALRAD